MHAQVLQTYLYDISRPGIYERARKLSFAGQGLCLNEEFSSQEAAAPCGSQEG